MDVKKRKLRTSKDKLDKVMNQTLVGVHSMPNVDYINNFYTVEKSNTYLSYLNELPFDYIWSQIYGRHYTICRRECMFADPDLRSSLDNAIPWTNELLTIKLEVEKYLNTDFNCMTATLFEDGRSNRTCEKQNILESECCVAVLNFGAPRKVEFLQKGKVSFHLVLRHGSLLTIHDKQWLYEIPIDRQLQEPTISLVFKKVVPTSKMPGTSEILEEEGAMKEDGIPSENSMHCENTREEDMGQDVCGNMVSLPSPMEKLVLQQILEEGKDIPTADLLKGSLAENSSTTKTLKEFNLSYEASLFVELHRNEIRIQLIEFCAKRQSGSGITMDLQTFYELGRKLENISYSLNYTSDSTIINNCIACVVKNYTLILKQMKGLRLMRDEIRLNSLQIKSFQDCLPQMEEFILDVIFIEQLKPSISADIPCDPIPMSAAFTDLERILKEDYQKTFERLYPCEFHSMEVECSDPCKKGYYRNIMNMSSTIREFRNPDNDIRIRPSECVNAYEKLSYKNMMTFSPAIKMLCRVPAVAEQFLSRNSRLSNAYNFKQLYQELFLTELEKWMLKWDV